MSHLGAIIDSVGSEDRCAYRQKESNLALVSSIFIDPSLSSPGTPVSSVMASANAVEQKNGWEVEKNSKLTGLCREGEEKKNPGEGDYNEELLAGAQGGNTSKTDPLPPLMPSKVAVQAERSERQEKSLKDVHIEAGAPSLTNASQRVQGHGCKDTLVQSLEQTFSSKQTALGSSTSTTDEKQNSGGVTGKATQMSAEQEGPEDLACVSSVSVPALPHSHNNIEILSTEAAGTWSSRPHLECSKEVKLQEEGRRSEGEVNGTCQQVTKSQVTGPSTVVDLDSTKDFSRQPTSTILNVHATPTEQLLDFAPKPPVQAAALELQGDQDDQHLERFKEAATMTISEEDSFHEKKCQDIEIQATADMFSRSTATSPYLFPATTAHCPCKVTKEESEILMVVSHVDTGSKTVVQEATGNAIFQRQHDVTHPLVRCQVHIDPSQSAHHVHVDHMIEDVRLERDVCKNQKTELCQDKELSAGQGGLLPCTVQKELPHLPPEHCRNTISASQSGQTSNMSFHDEGTSMADSQHQYKCNLGSENLLVHVYSSHGETPSPSYQGNTESTQPAKTSTLHDSSKKTKLQFVLEIDPAGPQMSNTDKVAENKLGPGEQPSSVSDQAGQPAEGDWTCGSDRLRESSKCEVVQDVLWDEQGMTWEVYGAALDPESLGVAIQSHLQTKIKEQERKVTAIRKSISSEVPQGRKAKSQQRNVFRLLMQNIRRPNCCTRPPPSSVQD
ncbi:G protein-regulated inducer of neurite outgrowth 3-like [Arapaima gigas]